MEGKATAVRGHPDSRKRMNPFLIVGILLIVMGIGTWFIGNLLWDYFWGLFPSTVWFMHDLFPTHPWSVCWMGTTRVQKIPINGWCMLELRIISNLVVGLVCLGYTYYCLVNGGTHSRYEGWKTKEEAPNTFRFSMILYTVIGIASLSNLAYSIFL